jgi:hypothetical protein
MMGGVDLEGMGRAALATAERHTWDEVAGRYLEWLGLLNGGGR